MQFSTHPYIVKTVLELFYVHACMTQLVASDDTQHVDRYMYGCTSR
jgi:hypothetical protein